MTRIQLGEVVRVWGQCVRMGILCQTHDLREPQDSLDRRLAIADAATAHAIDVSLLYNLLSAQRACLRTILTLNGVNGLDEEFRRYETRATIVGTWPPLAARSEVDLYRKVARDAFMAGYNLGINT